MTSPSGFTLLVLGATGKAGRYVVRHALAGGDDVRVFVRRPDGLTPDVRDRVGVIVGDVSDAAAVATAVIETTPSAIVICSGHPPKAPVGPLNAVAIEAIDRALRETGRLEACRVIYLSGLFANPPSEPLSRIARLFRAAVVGLSGYAASLADNLAVTARLMPPDGPRSELRFTIVRMGYPVDAPSRGVISPVDGYPAGAVTFDDMGRFLVTLAHGSEDAGTIGRAIVPGYAKGGGSPAAC